MTPWVTRLLIANVAMFLLQGTVPGLYEMLVFVPGLAFVRPWSLVTYSFLHGGFAHLLFNMIGLYFFGPRLEQRLGAKGFLALYFSGALFGALLSLFMPPGVHIIGASGAIYGILLGYALYWPHHRILIFPIPVPIEARVLVLLLALMSLGGAYMGGGSIAHLAHLGGFLGGFLYLKVHEHRSPAKQFQRKVQPELQKGRASSSDMERWSRIDRDALHPVNRTELDRVLAKLGQMGAGSLTPDERAFLDRFSQGAT